MVHDRFLGKVLQVFIRRGTLEITTERGTVFKAGNGEPPRVRARLIGKGATWTLLRDPELTLAELFVDGRLVFEEGSFFDFLQLLLQDSHGDRAKLPIPSVGTIRSLLHLIGRHNDPDRAKQNVAHHYDLSGELYDLFLDRHRQYSCAYFEHDGQSLDDAQRAKQRHLAAKLLLEPGQKVLDIGCGWGGLALYLADFAGADSVKGITLSEEQLASARKSAAQRGLADRVSFALEDYRSETGRFDRIVSVGMFEHVGPADYPAYFEAARNLLKEDGVMVLHTIGRSGVPGYTNPWVRKYIFPGGHLPTLSEVLPVIERTELIVTDVEVLRLHYAETLRAWRDRFMARRDEAIRLYDERFCRMWEAYLAMAEASFRFEDVVVFQFQLAKRNDVVPLTRDYISEREAALRIAESHAVAQAAE